MAKNKNIKVLATNTEDLRVVQADSFIRDLLIPKKKSNTDVGMLKGGKNALDSMSTCPICNKPMIVVKTNADFDSDKKVFTRQFNSYVCREHRINLPEV